MSDPRIEQLRRVPLFAGLPAKQLEFVASRVDEVDAPAGRTLITQGTGNHALHIILDGTVEVAVDGTPRATLGPGGYFGEISMLDRRPATATVTATSAIRLLVLSHLQFREAIRSDPDLSAEMLAAVGERLRADATARGEHSL